MMKFKLERQIPISKLYTHVIRHAKEIGMKGFVLLNQDVLDMMSQLSDEFANEMGWERAFGQYIYVEYKTIDKKRKNDSFQPVEANFNIIGEKPYFHIWSCEDDTSMEILVTEDMATYCLEENNTQQIWDEIVHSTSILMQLYILNNKGEQLFWNEILQINRHFELINVKTIVNVLFDEGEDKQQVLMSHPLTENIPLPPVGTRMQLMIKDETRMLMVSNITYNYLTPFKTLGEINIFLTEN